MQSGAISSAASRSPAGDVGKPSQASTAAADSAATAAQTGPDRAINSSNATAGGRAARTTVTVTAPFAASR